MIRIAVCDDDAAVRGQIVTLLRNYGQEKDLDIFVSEYQDGNEITSDILAGKRFHLIYMDIEMKEMDGMKAAEQIREVDAVVPLVFVTSYATYAIKGYDVRALTYLLKPVDEERFEQAFDAALKEICRIERYFIYETNRNIIKLPMKEILYFESHNKKVEAHLTYEVQSFTAKLDEIERSLEKSEIAFLRIHKSYLINFAHITRFNGDLVVLSNGKSLHISEKYCSQAKARYVRLVEMRKGH